MALQKRIIFGYSMTLQILLQLPLSQPVCGRKLFKRLIKITFGLKVFLFCIPNQLEIL